MYLHQRGRLWYALHEIPEDVRHHFGGAKRFCKSLKVADKNAAKRLAASLEARWRTDIDMARGKTNLDQVAAFYRSQLTSAKTQDEKEWIKDQIAEEAHDRLVGVATRLGMQDLDDPEFEIHPEVQAVDHFYKLATGKVSPFDAELENWIATLSDVQKTKDMKTATIKAFTTRFPTVQDVQRKKVQGWINDLVAKEGKKAKTVNRILSEVRGYWKYLVSLELAPEDLDPFDKLHKPQDARKEASGGDHWQPFTSQQVVDLLTAAKNKRARDPELVDLITLGMWTGARIESLCSLKIEDIKKDYFSIVDDKTAAGRRDVPIHTKLAPTITRLIGKRKTGFLFANLTENKYGDRSNAIGKRFGKVKTGLGFTESHTFHSIRKTVVTILENAGVPENVAADIVGHEKPTMTYGLYSGGNELEVKRLALGKLTYPGM